MGSVFLRPPDSDSSKSQLPADRVGASHWEEDLPTSHRRCDSSALIWPEDENINTYIMICTHLDTVLKFFCIACSLRMSSCVCICMKKMYVCMISCYILNKYSIVYELP